MNLEIQHTLIQRQSLLECGGSTPLWIRQGNALIGFTPSRPFHEPQIAQMIADEELPPIYHSYLGHHQKTCNLEEAIPLLFPYLSASICAICGS